MNFSIIVPAYNEERLLASTLASLTSAIKSLGVPSEIIVVDNNSTDRTAEIARSFGARVVFEPHNQISQARNAGARASESPVLIFVDADTLISPALLRMALERIERGACGGGAQIRFDPPLSGANAFGVRFWNGISARFHLAAGCFFFCRRDAFEEVGGFSPSVYASEEIWLSLALKRWGKKRGLSFDILTQEGPITSSRKFEWFSPLQLVFFLLISFLPFAVFFRRFCRFWYERPDHTR